MGLLAIPQEILRLVTSELLPSASDLSALARCSRSLHDSLTPTLYHLYSHKAALDWAAQHGRGETFTRAIACGVSDLADYGRLRLATRNDHASVVAILASLDKTMLDEEGPDEWTTLTFAAHLGSLNAVKALLAAGADLEKSSTGQTPLHAAAGTGKVDILKLLLDNGARMDTRIKRNGFTVLHTAVAKGSVYATELLLERGADMTAKDNEGYTPLFFAVRPTPIHTSKARVIPELLQLFMDRGADLHLRVGESGTTPLLHALDDSQTVETLLNYGADPMDRFNKKR